MFKSFQASTNNTEVKIRVYPDLLVNICPLGYNEECARIWINENTEHRIICNCQCHKKVAVVSHDMTIQDNRHGIEGEALVEVEGPLANAKANESPFQEVNPK